LSSELGWWRWWLRRPPGRRDVVVGVVEVVFILKPKEAFLSYRC
jgi:hypothetical protein